MSSDKIDPKGGPKAASPNAFVAKESEFKGAYSKQVFEVLKWSYRPYLKQMIFWIGLGWIGRVLLMGNTLVIGIWIDSLGGKSAPAFFQGWSATRYFDFLCLLSGLGFLLTLCFRLAFSRASVKAISSIYDETTVRVSRYPMSFFDRTPVGRIVTRFSSDYGNMFRMFGGPLSEFFGIVFDLAASMVLLTKTHPLGIALYFLLLGLNLCVYLLNKQKIRFARRDQSHRRSPGIAHFAETVQGAGVIRVFGKAQTFFERFSKLDHEYIEARFRSIRVNFTYAAEMMCSTYGVAFTSGGIGLWLISIGRMSPGELATVMVLLNLAGSSFQMFFDWMAQLEDAFVGVERMNEYLRLPLEPQAAIPAASAVFPTGHAIVSAEAARERPVFEGQLAIDLELKDLWFRYQPELPWILKGLDFKVKSGEKVGVIGRTGAGKTSLFQALEGFYPFDKGQILHGGRVLSVDQARKNMAMVPQEPILFSASMRENLTLAVDGAQIDDQVLIATLEKVGLSSWLNRFADPLDVKIEEKGKNLSQGEKQLLVMARMSLIQRPLILMDEATSSIDPQTEERLVNAMNQIFRGRTQLIIAHRLSTIESCDRILWLKDGRVELYDRPEIVLRRFQHPEATAEIGS